MKTKQIIQLVNILAWILFVVLCVEAGAIIVSSILRLAMPHHSGRLFKWADLSALFEYDKGHFIALIIMISMVTMLKAYLFFIVIKLMNDKTLTFSHPFNKKVNRFIFMGAITAFFIGVFSKYGFEYATWLSTKGLSLPDAAALKLDGAHVWLLMGIILFVIGLVFKRGIELQQEHDLTV